MKDRSDHDASAEAIAEVELNAQDLLELSTPVVANDLHSCDQPASSQPSSPIKASGKTRRTSPSSLRRATARWIVGTAGFAAAVVVAIGANQKYSPPRRVAQLPPATWSPMPEPATAIAVESPPTLFANPFDASEVFELPPGTSEDKAREMVADLLLKRAIERQAHVETRRLQRR
jgi:hypothetical protein